MKRIPIQVTATLALAAFVLFGQVAVGLAQSEEPSLSSPTPPIDGLRADVVLITPTPSPTSTSTPVVSATTLTIDPVRPLRQGERARLDVHLATRAGDPVVGERIDLFVNGLRQNVGRTDDTGTASFRLPGYLSVGVHTLEARFEGSTGLLASSSAATLQIVTPVPTLLIVAPHEPLPLGQRATFVARLLTTSGEPVANEPIEVYLDAERMRRTRTDDSGTASLYISRDFLPGKYVFSVVFPGSAPYLETLTSTELVVEPARLEVHAIPPLPGIQFSLDGRRFATDEHGIASIAVDEPGTYTVEALAVDPGVPGVRAEFRRWEAAFTPQRQVEIPKDTRLEVGFEVSHQVTLEFVDQEGLPVDPARITSLTLKSSGGGVHTFQDAGPHWLPAAHVIRTMLGIRQTELLYSLQDVVIRGVNVVNRSQQRFSVDRDDEWPIELLLYSLELTTSDALFGFPVGNRVRLQYPDGSFERHALNDGGALRLESLPRGEYRAKTEGVWGISPEVPVALSRDQSVNIQVISILDLALGAILSVSVALGLLFVGRPHLMLRLREQVPRLRDLAPRLRDLAPRLRGLAPRLQDPTPRLRDLAGRGWRVDWSDRLVNRETPTWAVPAFQAVREVKRRLTPGLRSRTGDAPDRLEPGSKWDRAWDREANRVELATVAESQVPIPVLAIAEDGPIREKVATALSGQAEFQLVQLLDSREDLMQQLLAAEPEIVILDDGLQGDTALEVIDELSIHFPDIAVVAITGSKDPAQLQQYTLAGARGFLERPLDRGDLLSTLHKLHELELRRRPRAADRATRTTDRTVPLQVLTIYGPRGGTGVSTLAVNLAIALHEAAFDKVLLVDGKLAFGHLAVMLNLRSASSLADLIPHPNIGDPDFLQQVVARHNSGIDVLPSPADLQVAQGIRPDGLFAVLHALRAQYEFIVVDAGSAMTENCLALLDAADRSLLVCAPELAALHSVAQFIQFARTRGTPANKGLVVLNRAGMAGAVATSVIGEVVKQDPFSQVPDDAANAMRALNRGVPLLQQSRRSPASKAIRRMALELAGAVGIGPSWEAAAASQPAGVRPRTVSARAG